VRKRACLIASLITLVIRATPAGEPVKVSGLIIPLDGSAMYLRTNTGEQKETRWTAKTKVALVANWRQVDGTYGVVEDDVLHYRIHSSGRIIDFKLPPGRKYALREKVNPKQIQSYFDESWLEPWGMKILCGETVEPRLPVERGDDTSFAGGFEFAKSRKERAKLHIGEKTFEVYLRRGQTDVLIYGALTVKDLHPFVNQATAIGHEKDGAVIADEIRLLPIGDQTASDDPKLPRYLCIGDSISGNYAHALKQALEGKVNYHHPATNCGPSGKGRSQIHNWLGAYEFKGRHWDVISFNFGHWDAGNTREQYQGNLETVIQELEKTGAKLVWVTTCPVPNGFPAAGELRDGKAPARTAGAMQKYLNPWALEVVKKHPQIAICDQWQFVKDHEGDIYADWWKGTNVHFGGEPADALGRRHAEPQHRRRRPPQPDRRRYFGQSPLLRARPARPRAHPGGRAARLPGPRCHPLPPHPHPEHDGDREAVLRGHL